MTIELEKSGLSRYQKIVEIANLSPIYCKDSETINEVVDKILKTNHRRLPIVSKKKLVGIITYMDILDSFLRGQKFDEKISTIMTRDIIFCESEDSIGYVLQKFKISRRGGLPILDKKKRIVGMVSERDFVKYFSNVEFGTKVEEIMTGKPFFVPPSISILDCLKSLVNTHYRRLPVVEDKKLIGIVTGIDFLRHIKEKDLNISNFKTSVGQILIKDVISISKEKDVSEAIRLMKTKDIGGIPVIDENKNLDGIITERDILEEII